MALRRPQKGFASPLERATPSVNVGTPTPAPTPVPLDPYGMTPQYVDPVVPQATERIGTGVRKGPLTPVESITPRIEVENEQRASTPLPIDYDALIAADPEYQLLLSKLQAAMNNAETDAGAETANVQAQTLRRLQQLKENGELGLQRSDNDFTGRGLGFSGGFLEDQSQIRRQVTNNEIAARTEETDRIGGIKRQLGRARDDFETNKADGLLATSAKVRGMAGELPPKFARPITLGGAIKATPQSAAPEVVSPAAVARRVEGSATSGAVAPGGVLGGRQRRRR